MRSGLLRLKTDDGAKTLWTLLGGGVVSLDRRRLLEGLRTCAAARLTRVLPTVMRLALRCVPRATARISYLRLLGDEFATLHVVDESRAAHCHPYRLHIVT
jgi:hypothetical protein